MDQDHEIFLLFCNIKMVVITQPFLYTGTSLPVNLQSSTGPLSGGEGGGVLRHLVW